MMITREQAKADGYTHEGTIYGFPAWMKSLHGDYDEFDAQTKLACVNFIPVACDMAFHAFGSLLGLMGVNATFACPFKVGDKI
jgi:hypothetical protein